jgi:hypothetical protein
MVYDIGKIAIMSENLIKAAGVVLLVLQLAGCHPGNQNSGSVGTQQPTPLPQQSPLTDFERDLGYVRNGLFTYIWVFSRKDGKPLDKDDAEFLRKNAPQVVDWVGTDGGKRFIAGTNFDLEKGNLELLKKRFVVEDYSAR